MSSGNSPYGCGNGVPVFDLDGPTDELDLEALAKAQGIERQVPVEANWNVPKCECGADKVGSPRHSPWCPKYKDQK